MMKVSVIALLLHISMISVQSVVLQDPSEKMGLMKWEKEQWVKCAKAGLCPARNSKTFRSQKPGGIPCVDGKVSVGGENFPCNKMNLLSHLSLSDLGSKPAFEPHYNATMMYGNDIWGYTDVLTKRRYALTGAMDGTSIVDVTFPENSVVVAWIPNNNEIAFTKDLKVYKHYVYIAIDYQTGGYSYDIHGAHGVQIVDLHSLRSIDPLIPNFQPRVISVEAAEEYAVFSGWQDAHNLIINEDSGYLYGVHTEIEGCSGGLAIADLKDNPMNPQYVGCYAGVGDLHDAHCVTYSSGSYNGREICFTADLGHAIAKEPSWSVVDVTDKSNIFIVSTNTYENAALPHQMWSTPNHDFLLIGDEWDELRGKYRGWEGFENGESRTIFFDIRDLEKPLYMGTYVHKGVIGVDHNLYIDDEGKYAYLSMYKSGVHVLDISGLATGGLESVTNVAYFDTVPATTDFDPTHFVWSGAWSLYIFDAYVVVQTIDRGLFVIESTFKKKPAQVQGQYNPYYGDDHESKYHPINYNPVPMHQYDYYADYIYYKMIAYLSIALFIVGCIVAALLYCIHKQSQSPIRYKALRKIHLETEEDEENDLLF